MKADLEIRTKWKTLVETLLRGMNSYQECCQEQNTKLDQNQCWIMKLSPKVIEVTLFSQLEFKKQPSSPIISLWIGRYVSSIAY